MIDDALDPAFCRAPIDRFEASPHRFAGRTGAGVDTPKKVSTDLQLDTHADWSDARQTLHERTVEHLEAYLRKSHFALIAPVALTHDNFAEAGAPMAAELMAALYRLGAVQMQKYDAGRGNYGYWHCEVYPQPGHEAVHRTLLWMYCLNDVDEGGETDFYCQRRAVRPRAGRMVIAPAHFTHTHRGRIPLSGDKYILTSWILLARPEQVYGETSWTSAHFAAAQRRLASRGDAPSQRPGRRRPCDRRCAPHQRTRAAWPTSSVTRRSGSGACWPPCWRWACRRPGSAA